MRTYKSFRSTFVISVAALLSIGVPALADVKIHRLFNDNMVLQRASDTPIFGTAIVGERVTVSALGRETSTVAGSDGRWQVTLDLTDAPRDAFNVTIHAAGGRTLHNVLAGEVWVFSGQSNMQMTLSQTRNGKAEAVTGNYPRIRQFDVPQDVSDTPLKDLRGWGWAECTPDRAGGFYAVPYYFAKSLHEKLDTPVGLICSKYGGTVAAAWTRHSVLESNPTFRPILERFDQAVKAYPEAKQKYDVALAEWERSGKQGNAPILPLGPGHRNAPGTLWNGMIAPLIPVRISGVVWYQGEQNVWEGGALEYRHLFPAMIADWRAQWGQGDFPFLFVQLPNFGPKQSEPVRSRWAELRESQLAALKLPNTAKAVTIDVGEADNVHPQNKKDVGERLALAALAKVYGKSVESSGPELRSMTIVGAAVHVRFDHAEGLQCKTGETPTGFAIAGEDRKFHWADAQLNGNDSVVLQCKQVPKPIAARYAWADTPDCNLVNAAGLPAAPFRTDDWPE